MSIGEIITTPTGLAVITSLQPTSVRIGGSGPVVGQLVEQEPNGGLAIIDGPRYRSITAQAATAYLSTVGESVPVETAREVWTGDVGAQPSGSAPGTGVETAPPSAHLLAAQAYQSTLLRATQPSPILVLLA